MNFLQPAILWAVPLIALPILIHLINQWRYQTRRWAPMLFLLQANRMNRGLAKIRQWLILAMRTIAIAGLIFAISRPLAGGLWGMLAGGRIDTAIVLVDRSPSMSDLGPSGDSKLQAATQQLSSALSNLGASRWVAIDSTNAEAREFPTLDALMSSNSLGSSSATSQISLSLQKALEYIQVNQPGSVDLWLCSDLRSSDWNPQSGDWSLIRSGYGSLPQDIRFHLLAFTDSPDENLSIRVTSAFRQEYDDETDGNNQLVLTFQVLEANSTSTGQTRKVPIQLEVGGVRSQLQVELKSGLAEVRELRIPLPSHMQSGWGRVSLPSDSNNADNDYFFVFESSSVQRVLLVADDAQAARPLQIAASVTADGVGSSQVELLSPKRVDSEVLEEASLVIWQSELPDAFTANALDAYVSGGGQIVFFPPQAILKGDADRSRHYHGVRWSGWNHPGANPVAIANWRSDQDLLAATRSGAGLPVGQLEIRGYGLLQSDTPLTPLATLDGGQPLLARLPTSSGGVYFCTAGTDSSQSSLAENGVVLFVVVQRAIQSGQSALQNMRQRDARSSTVTEQTSKPSDGQEFHGWQSEASSWQQIAGASVLTSEFEFQAGVYRDGQRLFAVNRPEVEDQATVLEDQELAELFQGLRMQRIDRQTDSNSSIFREIWRLFLILVIVALLVEALLCLPKSRKYLAVTGVHR